MKVVELGLEQCDGGYKPTQLHVGLSLKTANCPATGLMVSAYSVRNAISAEVNLSNTQTRTKPSMSRQSNMFAWNNKAHNT